MRISRVRFLCKRIPTPSCLKRSLQTCRSLFGGLAHYDDDHNQFHRRIKFMTLNRSKSTVASEYEDTQSIPRTNQQSSTKGVKDGTGDYYSITIEDHGKAISIFTWGKIVDHAIADGNDISDTWTVNKTSWKFSSALLWVNDPKYIHESSGQRIRTLGQYSRNFSIVSARIICVSDDDEWGKNSNPQIGIDSLLSNLHPAPPTGSLHSRGGIYDHTIDSRNPSSHTHDRILVKLEWNNGQESFFDLKWLIDHASNNCLGRWVSEKQNNPDHEIFSDNKDIQHECFKKRTKGRIKTMTEVTKEIAIGRIGNPSTASVSRFDYEEIIQNEETLFEGMQKLFEHGAILVQNAPNVEDVENLDKKSVITPLESIVGNLGKRLSLGNLSHGSLYGDVFHVKSKVDAENIAYTNVALPPHQDLTYYESKPFLQLLHCVTNASDRSSQDSGFDRGTTNSHTSIDSIVEGNSVLIDAIAAAEELRRLAPNLFDILCTIEATFVKERDDADIVSPKPHIVVDPNYGQVVEVNWSPPFEGPLQMHSNINVDDYIQAYQAIECMFDDNVTSNDTSDNNDTFSTFLPRSLESFMREYAEEYTWEYTLQKGDILVFNNQRMLHGRRSFSTARNVERHLIGCYTDAMDTLSRYRQLLRVRKPINGGGFGKRNPGNGCRWI